MLRSDGVSEAGTDFAGDLVDQHVVVVGGDGLEDLVLAYMASTAETPQPAPLAAVPS